MALIRFVNGYANMADAKLLEVTRFALRQLTGNSNFPTPRPTLAEVQTSINTFSDLVSDAKTGDYNLIDQKNAAKEALAETFHLLSAYVAFESNGSLEVARTSGLRLAKTPQPAPPIEAPQNLQAQNTSQSGTVLSSVDAVPGAVSYMHQYTTDPAQKEESWQTVTCSQRKCTITGLTPTKVYYFRVAAVGRKEQVMYSDVLSRVVA